MLTNLAKRATTHLRVQSLARFSTIPKAVDGERIVAPPMVYIKGEEMTSYCMELIMEKWIEPNIDTSAWEFYDPPPRSRTCLRE